MTDSSPGLSKGQISDIKLLRPTIMLAVPLVLDRILKEISHKLNTRSPIAEQLFTYLMDYKIYWKSKGYDTPIINSIFCKKVGEAFGGNLEYIIVGGAPLNERTQALIKAALNVKQLSQGLTQSF
jgi:long-chain acyl-CoA synthetase